MICLEGKKKFKKCFMPSLVREKKYNGSIVACTIGEGKD